MPGQFRLTGSVNQTVKDGPDAGVDGDVVPLPNWSARLVSNYPTDTAMPDGDGITYLEARKIQVLPNGQITEDGVTPGISLTAHDPALFSDDAPLQWTIEPGWVTTATKRRFRPRAWTFNAPLADATLTLGDATPVAGVQVLPAAPSGGGGGGGASSWSELIGKPSTFPPTSHTHPASEVTDFGDAARAATGVRPTLAHDFTDDTDGTPVTADSGQAWVKHQLRPQSAPTVAGGRYVTTDTLDGLASTYLGASLGAYVTFLEAEYEWATGGSTDGAGPVLLATNKTVAQGIADQGMNATAHISFSKGGYTVGIFLNSTTQTVIGTRTYDAPIATFQRVQVAIDQVGGAVYVRGADGKVHRYTSSVISAATDAVHATFELYYDQADTDNRIAYRRVAADTTPLTTLGKAPTKAQQVVADYWVTAGLLAGYATTAQVVDYAAPKADPIFTGNVVVPTPDADNEAANRGFVRSEIAALIAGAPGTLDTLKEIADALSADEGALAALTSVVGNKIDKTQLDARFPGVVELDAFPGATDDAKLTAAMSFAAAQDKRPAIRFPARDVTLTQGGRVVYDGMKLVGPAGADGPKNLTSGTSPMLTHRVNVAVGGGSSALFVENGSTDVYDVQIRDLAFQATNTGSQFYHGPTRALFACQFHSLSFDSFLSVFGTPTDAANIVQVVFSGHWTVAKGYACQFHLRGADNSLWNDAMLNIDTTRAAPGSEPYYVKFNGISKTKVGYIFGTAAPGWSVLSLNGSGSLGGNSFFGGTLEGLPGTPATQPLVVIGGSGGVWNFFGTMFNYVASAGIDGAIVQYDGRLNLHDVTYVRHSATAVTWPLLYQAGGSARVTDPFAGTAGESVRVRWSSGAVTTPANALNGAEQVTAADIAGKADVGYVDQVKYGFPTSNTLTADKTKWTAIAQVAYSTQYFQTMLSGRITDTGGGNPNSFAEFRLFVRQQAAMNNDPIVNLTMLNPVGFDGLSLVAVVTTKSASSMVVTLYGRPANDYEGWRVVPDVTSDTNTTWLSLQPFITPLPAGTQFAAVIDGRRLASTTMSATTVTLTIGSAGVQDFTGTANQTVQLPSAGVAAGRSFVIMHNGTAGNLTVQSSGGNTIATLTAGMVAEFIAKQATPTSAAHWAAQFGLNTLPASSVALLQAVNVAAQRAALGNVKAEVYGAFTTTNTVGTNADTNYTVKATNAITVTVPTAVGISGNRYRIKNANPLNSNLNVTVATTSSQTIDGDGTTRVLPPGAQIDLVSDGANWMEF